MSGQDKESKEEKKRGVWSTRIHFITLEGGVVWPVLSLVLVGLVLGSSFWLSVNTASHVPGPEGLLFWIWHGSW
jgi:hypothetical protein